MTPLLTIPLLAFVLTFVMHIAALKLFPQWNLLDFPERYNLKRRRLPYPTGVLAVDSFLIIFIYLNWTNFSMQEVGLLIGIFLLALTSFIDDRRPIPSWLRLAFQVLIALLIFATGSRIYTITNPLLANEFIKLDSWIFTVPIFGNLPILSGIFTVVWLMLTINALNWFDGIPGQVTILSTIGFLTIGLLSISTRVNQPEFALIAFILAAISFGCFLFDIPPPRVVLGDSGSMFFGLMLGTLTIFAGGKVATAFLVLGVPLIDSFFVITRRLINGKSPFKGSQSGEHLHHRLLAKGWKPKHIIALTASIGFLFGATALFLSSFQKLIAGIILFFMMLGLSWWSGRK